MWKKLMITTALCALTIGAAAAQSSGSTENQQSPPAATQSAPRGDMKSSSAQFINSQKPDQWLASNFRGTEVIGADNQKIGNVSNILFNKDGKIEAYIVSVGGFLGMGAKDVALAPTSFQVITGDKSKYESDKLKLSMSADQLKQAANFEPYNPPRATTGAGGPASRPSPMRPGANQ
jgi:sporulation protein YlmC with PRC-barrel domain